MMYISFSLHQFGTGGGFADAWFSADHNVAGWEGTVRENPLNSRKDKVSAYELAGALLHQGAKFATADIGYFSTTPSSVKSPLTAIKHVGTYWRADSNLCRNRVYSKWTTGRPYAMPQNRVYFCIF